LGGGGGGREQNNVTNSTRRQLKLNIKRLNDPIKSAQVSYDKHCVVMVNSLDKKNITKAKDTHLEHVILLLFDSNNGCMNVPQCSILSCLISRYIISIPGETFHS